MKRHIDWFIDRVTVFEWYEILVFAVSGLLSIAISVMLFVIADKVPATASDYAQLEEQIYIIQQNPDLLLEANVNITVKDEVITVIFNNDECKMTATMIKKILNYCQLLKTINIFIGHLFSY